MQGERRTICLERYGVHRIALERCEIGVRTVRDARNGVRTLQVREELVAVHFRCDSVALPLLKFRLRSTSSYNDVSRIHYQSFRTGGQHPKFLTCSPTSATPTVLTVRISSVNVQWRSNKASFKVPSRPLPFPCRSLVGMGTVARTDVWNGVLARYKKSCSRSSYHQRHRGGDVNVFILCVFQFWQVCLTVCVCVCLSVIVGITHERLHQSTPDLTRICVFVAGMSVYFFV